eukprot:CAMPEP_0175125604 /NCGR_PEP_ID=MMETSP0087-20121206/3402_1 /TAXON_ID=136419 /ORGANISM="Unknown Unknown, Strain D1" /LENGTH=35 /DNA_ID= /DNA_START= /DNA_END= /DNA_ORIENTATION=
MEDLVVVVQTLMSRVMLRMSLADEGLADDWTPVAA